MIKRSDPYSDSTISEPKHFLPGSEIFFAPLRNPLAPAPKIALVASIAWTLWNYRLALIQTLEKAGYEVVLIAADDRQPRRHEHRAAVAQRADLVLTIGGDQLALVVGKRHGGEPEQPAWRELVERLTA